MKQTNDLEWALFTLSVPSNLSSFLSFLLLYNYILGERDAYPKRQLSTFAGPSLLFQVSFFLQSVEDCAGYYGRYNVYVYACWICRVFALVLYFALGAYFRSGVI